MKLIFAQRLGPWLARNPGILHAVWRLEALLVRGLIALFRALGPERSATVGAWLLARFGPRARKKQPVVAATLRRVTPQLSEAERAKVLRASWESTGAVFAEYAHLEALASPERLALNDEADLPRLLAEKRGIIFVGAHYGNWEVLAMAASRQAVPPWRSMPRCRIPTSMSSSARPEPALARTPCLGGRPFGLCCATFVGVGRRGCSSIFACPMASP